MVKLPATPGYAEPSHQPGPYLMEASSVFGCIELTWPMLGTESVSGKVGGGATFTFTAVDAAFGVPR